MLKSILFTHDDMDGIGCKIVYSLSMINRHKNEYDVIVCASHEVDQKVMEKFTEENCIGPETEVTFADICPSRPVMEMVISRFNNHDIKGIHVYDHHKTNMYVNDLIPEYAIVKSENDIGELQSGTSLIFKSLIESIEVNAGYINEKLLCELVDTIRSYDTYEWKVSKNVMAKKLNILFTLIGKDNFFNKYFNRISLCDENSDLIPEVELEFVDCKYAHEQKMINDVAINDIKDVYVRGYRIAFDFKSIPVGISELSYQFLTNHPEFDAFMRFDMFNGGTYSFRTIREDLDCGKIFGLPIGGGGHPKAAGGQLNDDLKKLIQDIALSYLNGDEFTVTMTKKQTFHIEGGYNNEGK